GEDLLQGGQGFQSAFGGGLLLLVPVQLQVIVGHLVNKVQLLGTLPQNLAPVVEALAEESHIHGTMDSLLYPGFGHFQEFLLAQSADVFRVDGTELEGIKDG